MVLPRRPGPPTLGLLAQIRERQGRTDDAIALLRARHSTSVNGRDQLADLLARHGRIEELREYAASDGHGHAAQCLAEVLEERGDLEGAIAVYRQEDVASTRRYHDRVLLAGLLSRHGRGDEAIAVMRALADSPGGAEGWGVASSTSAALKTPSESSRTGRTSNPPPTPTPTNHRSDAAAHLRPCWWSPRSNCGATGQTPLRRVISGAGVYPWLVLRTMLTACLVTWSTTP